MEATLPLHRPLQHASTSDHNPALHRVFGLAFMPEVMAHIPEETLQQVLSATDIVDLIGRAVKLRRAGTNFVGLCPFHTEKTPSFNVSPSRARYHCFGCGAGGDAIRFVMEHDGLSFVEAVKRLADSAGIRIEEEVWDANAEKAAKQRAAMLKAHKEIAEWFHKLLMKHTCAEEARKYLKSRGITAEVAKNWQIGYAPAAAPMLRQWAAEHKFGQNLLVECGILAMSEERAEAYPRFRHRLMFPIRNDNGEVIAFSGRLLDPDAKAAKYLNSPETPLFSKSKVLFGFDKAKRAISKAGQAVVCEGQIDTLMVHEAGFQNVVASQGTAFTEFHARTLKRHADEVILCFDSDTAGYKAAERSFQILAPTGLNVKVAALPAGEDPDSLIRKQGPEVFAALLAGAKDFLDYQIEAAGSRRNMDEMRERVKFAEEMAANIRLLDSPVARETAIQRVAIRLGIPDTTIRKLTTAGPRPTKAPGNENLPAQRPGRSVLDSQDKTAALLCRMALADAEVLHWLRASGRDSILRDLPGTELLALVWRGQFDPLDTNGLNTFLAGLDRDDEAALTQLMFQPAPPVGREEAEHALRALEITQMQMAKQRLQSQLKKPDLSAEDAAEMHREIMALHRELLAAQREMVKPSPPAH